MLAAEVITVVDITGEDPPLGITIDKVRVALRTIACEDDRCGTTATHVGSMAAYVGGILRVGYFTGVVVVVIESAPLSILTATDSTVGTVANGGNGGTDGEVPSQDTDAIAADATVVCIFCTAFEGGRRFTEGDGTGAVFNFTTVVLTHDAAEVMNLKVPVALPITVWATDGDGTLHCTVLYHAPVLVAHDAANVIMSEDACIGEDDIVDEGTSTCSSEETYSTSA